MQAEPADLKRNNLATLTTVKAAPGRRPHSGRELIASRCAEFTTRSQINGRTLRPEETGESGDFSEIDLDRARLVDDLRGDPGPNEDAIPVVLALIDQIRGLRVVVPVLIERHEQ